MHLNLIGMVFGKLTVVSKAKAIVGGQKVHRTWGAWNCECDCGKLIVVKTIDLRRGSVKSCGCLSITSGRALKPNMTINKLSTISYANGRWLCQCACGEKITVKTNSILSGNTKSCGCLKSELLSEENRIEKLVAGRRKYLPNIASARRVWQSYLNKDSKTLSFEEFYKISQNNCHYCGVPPSTSFNYFTAISCKNSKKHIPDGYFVYNGLDRQDSLSAHEIQNVVACCQTCNRAKSNYTIVEFLAHISKMKCAYFSPIDIYKREMPNNSYQITSIKAIFYNYKDGNLTLEDFFFLSQLPCYYCGDIQTNSFSKAKNDKKSSQHAIENSTFKYNGLDRINSNLPHDKDNVVPCCIRCNFAKGKLSLIEFNEWILRVQEFQNKKGDE